MKIDKNILIFALLVLVMLFAVSSVSAEESLNENLTATDGGGEIDDINQKLATSDSGEELSAEGNTITVDASGSGDYTTISAAVSAASGGETIFIKNGEYTVESKIDTGSKSLNFKGETYGEVFIKSTPTKTAIFETTTTGSSLKLENLIFKDSSATSYGIINFGNYETTGNLDVINCTFENCIGKYGALLVKTLGDVNIENVVISNVNSTVTKGANAIYVQYATNNMNIKNVIINKSNYVYSGGFSYGVIYFNAEVKNAILDNVSISNCTGNVYGIINAKGITVVRNSQIKDNNLSSATADLFRSNNKGTLTIEKTIIANNICGRIFYNNQATSAAENTKLIANNNNIADNTFSVLYSGSAGCELNADYNYWGSNDGPSDLTVNNYIKVADDGSLTLNDGTPYDVIIPGLNDEPTSEEVNYDFYVDCYASEGGDGSQANPFNTISAAVTAASDGNSIFIKNGEYTESRITLSKGLSFIGESLNGVIIKSSATNGLFYTTANNGKLSFMNLTIKDVRAGSYSAIYIGGNGELEIINCIFDNCGGKFGSINIYTSSTTLIDSCNIINSKCTSSGGTGAIYFAGTGTETYTIKNTVIDNATVTTGYISGVLYNYNTARIVNVDNLTIINCNGASYGIINTRGDINIKNSKFTNNIISKFNGNYGYGLLYVYGSKTLSIESSILKDNSGSDYIVYAQADGSQFNLNYNYIENNSVINSFVNKGINDFEYNYWGSNDKPTDPSVTHYAVMNSEGQFVDDEGNPLLKEIPVPTDESEPQPIGLETIYVSNTGSDDNDGISQSTPVQSISKAIELAENGGKIIILPGEYTLTETLSITKDLTIEARGNVLIKSSSLIISTSNVLTLTNVKFESDAGIVSTTNDLTIDSCVFLTDSQSASAISADGGNVNIANSVLLNPTGYALTATSQTTVNANNNWWGKNDAANSNEDISSWILMDAIIDLEKINKGDEVTITVSFAKTNNGDYTGTLPEFNITVKANNMDKSVQVKSNHASEKYIVNEDDEAIITSGNESIKISLNLYDSPEIIYVSTEGNDNNEGDSEHPVSSISKAIELAKKGKIIILEGTYTLDNTLTVSNDLDIKGEGTVVINGNDKRFLSNTANLNITNVQFTNGKDNGGALLNNGNLTLNNTIFYSNVNLNGYGASVIRNNKKLIIIDSKFYENKARYGNIHNTGDLLINNTEFYNNDMQDVGTVATGLAVYSEAGNAVIENSKFHDNKGNFSVIYFQSKDLSSVTAINNLTIDNCTFENNELVRYGVIYSKKANTTIKDSTFANNVVKKGTASDAQGSAIYVDDEQVAVETSVFINNKAETGGNDIYVYKGQLNVTDSVLINENGYSIEKADAANVVANDNWWGANTPNTPIEVERYIVMTVTSNDNNIEVGDEIIIIASFDKTNDGNAYTGDLPEVFNVSFTSTSGNLNEVKTIKDKKAEVTYTVDLEDKYLTVTSNDAVEQLKVNKILDIIYVSTEGNDENDGDLNSPVATLAKAIELAQKGQIIVLAGSYITEDLGVISNDLNITGQGEVIINADSNGRILYVGNDSKVILKNLILKNGYVSESKDESGALLGNNGNLTIINCTLKDSRSEKNAGAIFNARDLTVINSTFENNYAARNGGAIFTQKSGAGDPTLTVINSTFKQNKAKGSSKYGGGAIFVQQASNVIISDTLFEENGCEDYGGGAIEIVNTNTVSIDNCSFIENTANGEDYKDKSDYGGGAISFVGSYADTKETLTITNSLFINNRIAEMGGGAIYARYSTVDVSNSVFINNTDDVDVSIYRRTTDISTAKITANDNWWGSNDNPKSKINGGTLTRWAILTVSNASEIKSGETVELTVSINQYTTGSVNGTLTNPIKVQRPVTIYTNLGTTEGTLINGEFKINYNVPEGLKIISATVDDELQVLYVITTDTNVKLDNITGLMGDRFEYTINVTTVDGEQVNTGYVELYFGETLIKTIPVLEGKAKDTIVINKETGVYDITAKYIDPTQEFANKQSKASLNVTGIDNIVTPENFNKFFDENNILLSDVPFDEILFKGTFNNIGVITINKSIKLSGIGAQFNNVSFVLNANDIELNNMSIVCDKTYSDSDGALIYIGGNNVKIINNNIIYNAEENMQSYAILADIADNVKIINNIIRYDAKSEGVVYTIPFSAYKSNNLIFENNKLDASISSVPVGYDNNYNAYYYSEGVSIKNSENVSFNKNDINIKYNVVEGMYDTVNAVHFDGCDDSRITDNDIQINGHSYAYGLIAGNSNNLLISGNDIKSYSDDHYAAALQVNGKSTANVENNNILAKSVDVAYPVCLDDWGHEKEVNLTGNVIKGESNTVYGVYVEENKTTIKNNIIDVSGNHVYGIITHQTDVKIDGNNITVNGTDIGSIVSPQSGVNENTTGIIVSQGSAVITNNNVLTTGKNAVTAMNTNASIINNGLTANGASADNSIKNINSNIVSSGNTEAFKKQESKPAVPVVKITATKNAKVDYGFTYKVRVTSNGKSVGAGKQVTLKIAGKTLKAKTDKNGYAKFTLAVKPKAYTVTVTYNKVSQKYKLTVKNVIKAKNVKVKKSAKKVRIKISLKTSKNKPIKSKNVILKINGKKIKAKTNKKGVATFKVKKSILKKLKAGKKYKYQVIYGKDIVKKTLKVKK